MYIILRIRFNSHLRNHRYRYHRSLTVPLAIKIWKTSILLLLQQREVNIVILYPKNIGRMPGITSIYQWLRGSRSLTAVGCGPDGIQSSRFMKQMLSTWHCVEAQTVVQQCMFSLLI